MKSSILLATMCMVAQLAIAQSKSDLTQNFMYTERNVFYLKFGTSREALPMWKEYLTRVQQRDSRVHGRLLTDVSGTLYVLVVELTYDSFHEMEPSQCRLTNQPDWKEFYQRFVPLCEKAERTYYKNQLDF